MSETPKPQSPWPDLKLEACVVFATGPMPILQFTTASVIVPLVGLRHNIKRLKNLILAPARISFLGAYSMNLYARAELEKTGKISEYDPTVEMKSSQDISARVAELFVQESQKLLALAGTPEAETKRLKRLLDGTNILQMFAIDFSVEAMLWSYITGMWTAFETMAGDGSRSVSSSLRNSPSCNSGSWCCASAIDQDGGKRCGSSLVTDNRSALMKPTRRAIPSPLSDRACRTLR
jgi:hypothetical protein